MHRRNNFSIRILEEQTMGFGIKATARHYWVSRSHPSLLRLNRTSLCKTSCHKWQGRSAIERKFGPRGEFYHFSQPEQLHLLPTLQRDRKVTSKVWIIFLVSSENFLLFYQFFKCSSEIGFGKMRMIEIKSFHAKIRKYSLP